MNFLSLRCSKTFLLASFLAAGALPAQADEPSQADRKMMAQALFDEGRMLSADGRQAEACPKFAESLRLDPTIPTKFYLAECYEKVGRIASAWLYYVEVADALRSGGQATREKPVRQRADALKPKLARLTITVPAPLRAVAGLEIKRDGAVVGDAQWGVPIPIDRGEHTVSATADGKNAWDTTVRVTDEGSTVTVTVPMLEDAPPPPLREEPPPKVEPPPPPPPPPPRTSPLRMAGMVVGGVGAAGLIAGIVSGVVAVSKKGALDGHCQGNVCDATGADAFRSAATAADVSTVGLVVGGVLFAGGAAATLLAPRASSQASARIELRPGGVVLHGRW